jgi:hypothetical protein
MVEEKLLIVQENVNCAPFGLFELSLARQRQYFSPKNIVEVNNGCDDHYWTSNGELSSEVLDELSEGSAIHIAGKYFGQCHAVAFNHILFDFLLSDRFNLNVVFDADSVVVRVDPYRAFLLGDEKGYDDNIILPKYCHFTNFERDAECNWELESLAHIFTNQDFRSIPVLEKYLATYIPPEFDDLTSSRMYLDPGIFSSLPLIVLCFQIDYNGQTVFEKFLDYSDGVEDAPVKLVKLDITNNNPICPVKISNDDLLIHHLDTVCGALQTSFFHFAVPSSGFELLEPQNLPPGDYFFNGPGRMIYFDHEVQASYCSTCFEK